MATSSDPAYYSPDFYQKIRRYYNNRMIQTGRPPTKEELQAMMEAALNQAGVMQDAAQARQIQKDQFNASLDLQKQNMENQAKTAKLQTGLNAVGTGLNTYFMGKELGMWGGGGGTAAGAAAPSATTGAVSIGGGMSGAMGLGTGASLATPSAIGTGVSGATGAEVISQPLAGSAGGGGLGAAANLGIIGAGIALNQSFAQRNAQNKAPFEGQTSGGAASGQFATEPWLASLTEGATMGEKFDAAVKNRDWSLAAKRAAGAGMHWTDPLKSASYEVVKDKAGGTVATILFPDIGVTDWLSDECIIVTTCHGRDSEEVNITRRFRDTFMSSDAIRGYYIISEALVPLMFKHEELVESVKHDLVDNLIEFGKWKLKITDKCSRHAKKVTKAFLKACDSIGKVNPIYKRVTGEVV